MRLDSIPSLNQGVGGSIGELAADYGGVSLSSYLGAKFSQGVDYALTGILMDYLDTRRVDNMHRANKEFGMLKPLTRRQIESSPYYREGVDYREGETTQSEMQSQAERFDARREAELLIDKSEFGARSLLGFGAMMAGSLLSPESFVGLGSVKAGSSLAINLARAAGTNMLMAGGIDLAVLPHLKSEGENVGIGDFILDVGFAGLLGLGLTIPGARAARDAKVMNDGFNHVFGAIGKMYKEAATDEQRMAIKNLLSHHEELAKKVAGVMDATTVESPHDINIGASKEIREHNRVMSMIGKLKDTATAVKDHIKKFGKNALDHDIASSETILDGGVQKPPTMEEMTSSLERARDEMLRFGDTSFDDLQQEFVKEFGESFPHRDASPNMEAVKSRIGEMNQNVEKVATASETILEAPECR